MAVKCVMYVWSSIRTANAQSPPKRRITSSRHTETPTVATPSDWGGGWGFGAGERGEGRAIITRVYWPGPLHHFLV